MIFHENRLLADCSHEISYLIFFRKLEKMSQNLSSAAVVVSLIKFAVKFLIKPFYLVYIVYEYLCAHA